jgi:hypothetical protein
MKETYLKIGKYPDYGFNFQAGTNYSGVLKKEIVAHGWHEL